MDEAHDILTDYEISESILDEPEFITDLVIVKVPSYITSQNQ